MKWCATNGGAIAAATFDKRACDLNTIGMKLPLSVVVVAKNEARNIERCLRSVAFAEETLVIENESTDGTAQLAQKLGARVLREPWRGYGPTKAFGARAAKFDWILSLDADEAVSPELAAEIAAVFKDLDAEAGYEIPRRSFHMGRWILHGGWYPDRQLRLFNRRYSMWNDAKIHEKVICPKTSRLKSDLEHFVFRDLHQQIETNNRYSTLQAEEWIEQGKRFVFWRLIFKPGTKFVETYFWKLGFLDGMPGFIIAVGAAYSVFLRWSKVWEKQKGFGQ